METFWLLNRDRPYTYGGPLPIQLASFRQYVDLFEDPLTPFDIAVLMALDSKYLEVRHKMQEQK